MVSEDEEEDHTNGTHEEYRGENDMEDIHLTSLLQNAQGPDMSVWDSNVMESITQLNCTTLLHSTTMVRSSIREDVLIGRESIGIESLSTASHTHNHLSWRAQARQQGLARRGKL